MPKRGIFRINNTKSIQARNTHTAASCHCQSYTFSKSETDLHSIMSVLDDIYNFCKLTSVGIVCVFTIDFCGIKLLHLTVKKLQRKSFNYQQFQADTESWLN